MEPSCLKRLFLYSTVTGTETAEFAYLGSSLACSVSCSARPLSSVYRASVKRGVAISGPQAYAIGGQWNARG